MPSADRPVNADGAAQNLGRQGGIVASMTLLSRITGFARDMVISHLIGASALADAFFVAFRIPNFFRRSFAEGAFSQAFVPVLAEYHTRAERSEFDRFVRAMLGNFSTLLAGVCIAGVLAAPYLVVLFAPGFVNDQAQLALTAEMLRITFPYLGFIALTAFAAAVLNVHHRYALAAATPVLLNLALIAAALWLAPLLDPPVLGLAWGVFIAGAAQLVLQVPAVRALNVPLAPRIEWRHPGARRVAKLVVPAVFAASVTQVNTLVDTILASLLVSGSISWLYYADRLMELPIGIVAVAIGTVLLPNLSRLNARGDVDGVSGTLDWGLRVGVVLGLPAGAALYVLALPLVATIFQHGALTAHDAAMASLALEAFAAGTLGFVLAKIAAPGYFARQDTRTPLRIAIVSVSVNLVVSLALFRVIGHVGLAIATSAAALVQAYLLLRGLLVRGVYRPRPGLGLFLLRVVIATAAMVAVLLVLRAPREVWLTAGILARALDLALLCGAGAVTYLVALRALGIKPSMLVHRV